MSDEDVQAGAAERARNFRDEAPTTAAAAAKIILNGVKAERWRLLVGDEALRIDELIRQTPKHVYGAGIPIWFQKVLFAALTPIALLQGYRLAMPPMKLVAPPDNWPPHRSVGSFIAVRGEGDCRRTE
jgi:hypothetical protein